MKVFKDSSDKKWGIITLGVVVLMTIIASIAFLGKSQGDLISGWEALNRIGGGFWTLAIGLTIGAGVLAYFGIKVYDKQRDVSMLKPFLAGVVLFLALAWGKGCDVKQSGGVTGGKGRLVKIPKDTTRVAAEDLLQKK